MILVPNQHGVKWKRALTSLKCFLMLDLAGMAWTRVFGVGAASVGGWISPISGGVLDNKSSDTIIQPVWLRGPKTAEGPKGQNWMDSTIPWMILGIGFWTSPDAANKTDLDNRWCEAVPRIWRHMTSCQDRVQRQFQLLICFPFPLPLRCVTQVILVILGFGYLRLPIWQPMIYDDIMQPFTTARLFHCTSQVAWLASQTKPVPVGPWGALGFFGLRSWKWFKSYKVRPSQWCLLVCKPTSSTAQGGGESFKNRKPIGEVGCCESRMAERIHWWTERWLELWFLEWLQWLQRSPHHNCWM